MNDSQLEAFVRDQYHQTKNSKNKRTKAPQTYHNSKSHYANYNAHSDHMQTSLRTSGFNISNFLYRDSSCAQINANEPKIYLDQNKIIYSSNPVVVMVGIDDYTNSSNVNHQLCAIYDYINVNQMLHDIKHYDIVYHNSKHDMIHLHSQSMQTKATNISNCNTKQEFAFKWSSNDLDKFNNQLFDIINDCDYDYDCLMYIISSRFKVLSNGRHIVYDSNGNEYSCDNKIFDKFNNRNCSKLCKKAKIFVLQDHNNHDNDKFNDSELKSTDVRQDTSINNIDEQNINFVDQYKRIVYFKHNKKNEYKSDHNVKDGGLLVSAFCASLCNDGSVNDKSYFNQIDKEKKSRNLDDIINETENRLTILMNKLSLESKFYDENYIPIKRKIIFTSYKPLKSTVYYD